MKHKYLLLFLGFIISGRPAYSQALEYYPPVRTMDVPARTVDITFDGVADEASWSDPQLLSVFNQMGWDGTDEDFSGYFQVCWDMHYMYLFVDITDDVDHSYDETYDSPWMFDCIEFHLNLDTVNDDYSGYDDNTMQVRINRGIDSVLWTGRAQAKDYYYYWMNKPAGDGWIVEAAIPWTSTMPEGSLPEDFNDYVENMMGMEVMFSDSDMESGDPSFGERDAQSAWDSDLPDGPDDWTEDLAWNNVLVFGIVDLIGSPAPPPPPPPPPPEPKETIYKPVNMMVAPLRQSSVVIDAADEENSYSEKEFPSIFNYVNYEGTYDLSGYYKCQWDSSNFYLYAFIRDHIPVPWPGTGDPREYDNVEIFFDLDTSQVSPIYDTLVHSILINRGTDSVTYTANLTNEDFAFQQEADGDDSWEFEISVPWRALLPPGSSEEDFLLYKDNVIGFEVMYNDFDNENMSPADHDAQAAWDLDDGLENFASDSTWAFGLMLLSEEQPPPSPDPYIAPVRTMEVPAKTMEIIFDGHAQESCWGDPQEMFMFDRTGYTDSADLAGYIQTCWDREYLYFFASIIDEYEHNYHEGGSSWEFDCIEFHLDLDTNHQSSDYDENTIQLRLNRGVDSLLFHGRAESSGDIYYHWHNKPNETGWIVEAGIPWKCAMPEGSLPEDFNDYVANKMGFDIAFSDSDNADGDEWTGNRDAMAAWDLDDPDTPDDRTEDLAWNNTHVFGIIELIGEPTSPPPPPPDIESDPLSYIQPVRTMVIDALYEDPIELDGMGDEEWYSEIQVMYPFDTTGIQNGETDLNGYFRTAWDMEYLYLFAEILDDEPHIAPGGTLYPELYDNLEIYIDFDTTARNSLYDDSTTVQLRYCRGWSGIQQSGRATPWDFGYYYEELNNAEGWRLELAIPWIAALPEGTLPSDFADYLLTLPTIGFDVIFNDSDGETSEKGARDAGLAWDYDFYYDTDEGHIERTAEYNTRAFGLAKLDSYMALPGIEDKEIRMYPNPANQQVYFDNLDQTHKIELYSIDGSLMKMVNDPVLQQAQDPERSCSIDVSSFDRGVYLVRIISEEQVVTTFKLVVE